MVTSICPNASYATRGFSLVELLIAMALGIIIMTAVVVSFVGHNDTYVAQDDLVEMQQNARAAMQCLMRDIRSVGYDPKNQGDMGITTANNGTSTTLSFTRYNADIPGEETVTYSLDNNGELSYQISPPSPPTSQLVAGHIKYIEFTYLDADGNKTGSTGNIRSIQISIMVQSAHASTKLPPPIQTYIFPSGTSITSDAGYRSMFITDTVLCRNLGL